MAKLAGSFIVAAFVAVAPVLRAGDPFAIVVNAHNPMPSVSHSELKRIVSGGTKVWSGGAVVQLGIIPGDAPETTYFASLVDMTPRELLALIQQQIFKGELRRPAVLRTSADCVAFAGANPGAICVASSSTPIPPTARVVDVR